MVLPLALVLDKRLKELEVLHLAIMPEMLHKEFIPLL
jgi:hypothetical protein